MKLETARSSLPRGWLALLVVFLVGSLAGIWTVETFAPSHPHYFCKPVGDRCVDFPWRP